jgi:hypothetical protein
VQQPRRGASPASAPAARAVLRPGGDAAYLARVSIPAIVTAGAGPASKTVLGQNKVYLEIEGLPLVARVVQVLQRVPEISEVWVVGDADRLGDVFARPEVRSEIEKPLHIVQQFRNLYENAWQTYRRALPGAGPEGRAPVGSDLDQPVLYLSGDLPFATPQEISEFITRGLALGCDYAVGLVPSESLAGFLPGPHGETGIRVAYFNMREGRFRQSNLHLAKPARIVNRRYIEEMYELRYQKEFANIAKLAWTILRSEQGGLRIVFLYLLVQLAGLLNRHGFRRLADKLRRFVPLELVESCISSLLRTDYRFVVTEAGGCALDIDNQHEYEASVERFGEWSEQQTQRSEDLYGPPRLDSGKVE